MAEMEKWKEGLEEFSGWMRLVEGVAIMWLLIIILKQLNPNSFRINNTNRFITFSLIKDLINLFNNFIFTKLLSGAIHIIYTYHTTFLYELSQWQNMPKYLYNWIHETIIFRIRKAKLLMFIDLFYILISIIFIMPWRWFKFLCTFISYFLSFIK